GPHTLQCCSALSVVVDPPGLAVSDRVVIGHNLEIGGVLSLGEPAPEGGLDVILETSGPDLLVADSATAVGSHKVNLHVPAGNVSTRYFLQALADSGTIKYGASASGYRSGSGTVTLAPSGVLL